MRVRLTAQVVEFVRSQSPVPRRKLRQALRELGKEKGDLLPLEAPLQDYHRLRVGPYRVILRYTGKNTIDCVFAERRSIVYEVFSDLLIERLAKPTDD
jgi:mRNA-degrading endonuclease RelE of RelBE toxin-antitoxin system